MNKIKVAFFTEAGSRRGMGHLIRCKAIEQEFNQLNIYTEFFLDSDIDYSYKYGNIEYFKWSELIIEKDFDIIIIDSYEAGETIYNKISKSTKLPVYLDDYRRLNYPRGAIINFSPSAEGRFYIEKNNHNTYLLGIDFTPIRNLIKNQRPKEKEHELFLMLGGQDTCKITETILSAMDKISSKIVVSNNKDVFDRISRQKNTTPLYKPSDHDLIEKISSCKLAITTASMTAYELNFLNIPSIIISVSKNQEIGATDLIANGISEFHVSISNKDWLEKIVERYNLLLSGKISNQKKLVDGNGCKRIVKALLTVLINGKNSHPWW